MAVCIAKVDLKREKGYLYFIDKDGDISRTKRSTGHYSEKHPHKKVLRVGIQKVPGMWYYMDKQGNICMTKPKGSQ